MGEMLTSAYEIRYYIDEYLKTKDSNLLDELTKEGLIEFIKDLVLIKRL